MSLTVHEIKKMRYDFLQSLITFKGTGEQLKKPKARTKQWKGEDKQVETKIRRKTKKK